MLGAEEPGGTSLGLSFKRTVVDARRFDSLSLVSMLALEALSARLTRTGLKVKEPGLGRASMNEGFLPPDEVEAPLLPVGTLVTSVGDCEANVADGESFLSNDV